ncbi:MAG TPA: Spy/CpxP family protein refolding chaperone [Pseudolabrys sp.]|nr:Spy/CpxP family protein refolding chaperone [Pseudolabrys sp.]
MMKSVLAGATVLAIAGASLAYAQQPAQRGPGAERWKPSVEDMGAFTDARIAALHAGLKLTPEQEKKWPAVESALRDMAKQRADRVADRMAARADAKADAQGKTPDKAQNKAAARDPIERMRQRAERMTQTGAGLKKLADAAAPLYESLDQAQKRRFTILSRIGGEGAGRHFARYRQHGEHGMRHARPRGDESRGAAAPRPQQ